MPLPQDHAKSSKKLKNGQFKYILKYSNVIHAIYSGCVIFTKQNICFMNVCFNNDIYLGMSVIHCFGFLFLITAILFKPTQYNLNYLKIITHN